MVKKCANLHPKCCFDFTTNFEILVRCDVRMCAYIVCYSRILLKKWSSLLEVSSIFLTGFRIYNTIIPVLNAHSEKLPEKFIEEAYLFGNTDQISGVQVAFHSLLIQNLGD